MPLHPAQGPRPSAARDLRHVLAACEGACFGGWGACAHRSLLVVITLKATCPAPSFLRTRLRTECADGRSTTKATVPRSILSMPDSDQVNVYERVSLDGLGAPLSTEGELRCDSAELIRASFLTADGLSGVSRNRSPSKESGSAALRSCSSFSVTWTRLLSGTAR